MFRICTFLRKEISAFNFPSITDRYQFMPVDKYTIVFRLKTISRKLYGFHNWPSRRLGLKLHRAAVRARYQINGVKSSGSWNLICILYSRCTPRCTRCILCLYMPHFFSGQIFTRRARVYSPVIPRPRAATAYNRINVVIRTSLQCNSLALQSSEVFTPSCLYLFHFRNIISPTPSVPRAGTRWDYF